MPPLSEPPPYTADLPGVGGRVKDRPEDFEVEEIPAYPPSGEGDHLYLWVEKRGVGAEYFARHVARRLGLTPGEVGTAGLKDRHAVTRQAVSVPAAAEPRLADLDGDGVRLLAVLGRHGNKLKPGHLRGNRFNVLVRGVGPDALPAAEAVLARLNRDGLPNYYGAQRFGRGGETAETGFRLLRGEAVKVRSPFLRKLALSAAQSALFNDYLARRVADGLFRRVVAGDVMAKWPLGGMFRADDVPAEQARFDARETVTAGPMFGKKTFPAAGAAAEREAAVLADAGLTAAQFAGFGKLLMGTRRHNVVYADGLSAAAEADGLRLTFTLPAGSYATVLLREVTKAETAGDEADGGE